MSGAKRGLMPGPVAALVVVALLAAGVALYATSPTPRTEAPPQAEAVDPTPPPADDPAPARPPAAGKGVPELRQDPLSPRRAQPYRPAKPLKYSEGVPATSPGDDDRSPTLLRLLAVTQATPAQEARIRQAWRAHEDGRRVLLAEAHPPSIGLPVLDPQRLMALDRAFDQALMAETLDMTQRQRLLLELGPNRVPPPEPPPAL